MFVEKTISMTFSCDVCNEPITLHGTENTSFLALLAENNWTTVPTGDSKTTKHICARCNQIHDDVEKVLKQMR